MKIKKIILTLFTSILLLGCDKSIEKNQLELHHKIDTLLVKANDDLLDRKLLLIFTDSVYLF